MEYGVARRWGEDGEGEYSIFHGNTPPDIYTLR